MRIAELRYREVINLADGRRLGYVCDADLDLRDGRLTALIVPGALRFFGLLGREEDYVLPFECITRVGDDIIFVDVKGEYVRAKRRRPLGL